MHISKPGEFARVLTHSNLYQDFQTIKDNTQGSISAAEFSKEDFFVFAASISEYGNVAPCETNHSNNNSNTMTAYIQYRGDF